MAQGPKQPGEQPENGFTRLGSRLAKVTRRSNFSIWLAKGDNFQRLTAEKEKHGVRWEEIAQWAIEEGHTNGKPLTAIGAKRAYEREKSRRQKKPHRPVVSSASPVVVDATAHQPLGIRSPPAPSDLSTNPDSGEGDVDFEFRTLSRKPKKE